MTRRGWAWFSVVCGASSMALGFQGNVPPAPLPELVYDAPFFPGATYDPAVPTPDAVLGFPVGSKPATAGQVEAVFKAIAEKSGRTRLFTYATSHEGRDLHYLVIASPENIARLDALKGEYQKLADPRSCTAAEADALVKSVPALAWMAYVIHGNEMSGTDASLAAAYHLAAGTGEDVKALLKDVVVVIDPLMNPDGRDRCLNAVAEARTRQPSVDDQSLLHTGIWPSGRMNHYLFDMNRDWIYATQPETRGRVKSICEWAPHYFMESHEMGSQDTFLFMPPRAPWNPHYPENVRKWEEIFAKDQGAAFDAKGWRYYTGEWNEGWYPGYSSSWAALRGSVENLYEQARIISDGVRRPEGTIESYREAVHKQLVSTMANLTTLAKNRQQVLTDYVAEKRLCVSEKAPGAQRVFAVVPAPGARARQFMDLMALQRFEGGVAGGAFKASGRDRLGKEFTDREFPAGTLLFPQRQPEARLLATMLEFDPRMTKEFLTDERRELLRFGRSKLYDITGWAVPLLFDLECFEITAGVPAGQAYAKVETLAPARVGAPIDNAATTVGFVIDGSDDASVRAAGRLMERGVQVRLSLKPFAWGTSSFVRGSLVVTRKDNTRFKGDLNAAVEAVCTEQKVSAVGVATGLGEGDVPDIGGENFVLLTPARIAVVGREPFGAYSYGTAWYMIDHVLGQRASYLDFGQLGGLDLRRYNVIVLPDGGGDGVKDKIEALKSWVQAGGTLVAIGSSASALAKEKDGIGSARLLPNVLTKPEPYYQAVIREWEGRVTDPTVESAYSFTPPPGEGDGAVVFPWDGAGSGGDDKPSEEEVKRRDEWRKIFMPQGAVIAARVDDRSWLTSGCRDFVPVMYTGDTVLVTPPGVDAPARLGVFAPAPPAPPKKKEEKKDEKKDDAKKADDKKSDDKKDGKDKDDDEKKPKPGWTIAPPGMELRLRMSGLLWPEAAERIANSAYVVRETVGAGQIILFASDPNFRAATLGTARIFSNAVIYGPGLGASEAIRPRKHAEE